MTLYEIIKDLEATSGTNDKIAKVAALSDNQTLRQMLFLENDQNTSFGMKKVPAPALNANFPEAPLEIKDVFSTLDDLATRRLTGNAAKEQVAHELACMSEHNQYLYTQLIKRDLRIAMGLKNVNKALGKDFLQETPYMRCDLTTKKTLAKIQYPAISEVKMDGQYLNHIVRNGCYEAVSRNGKPYDFMGVMDEDFAKLAQILETDYNIVDPVFNGEAVVKDDEGNVLPRTTGNGIIQKFGKDTGNIFDAENVLAVLWDVLPYEAYRNKNWKVPRKDRREILVAALAKLDSPRIRMVEFKEVQNFAEAVAYNTEVMARGDEGTILKDERGPWKAHTSPWQLKLKLKFEIDLKVVGFEEGADGKKFKDSLGALIIESECGMLRCKVGTGFKEKFCPAKDKGTKKEYSDDMVRQYIWDNRDEFLGKIVTVEANDIVQDRNSDILKLFLPVFVEWRHDKDQYDDITRIREMKQAAILAAMGA